MSAGALSLGIEPLCQAAFAAFGEVIEATPGTGPFAINGGTSQRFHGLANLEPGPGGRLIVSIFRAQPRVMPFAVRMLERHPKSSQTFMPLSGHPFLVVVAPPGPLDPDKIQAFLAQAGQGVNFAPGTWHHALLALQAVSDFLVIDRDDPDDNCEEQVLATERWLAPEIPC